MTANHPPQITDSPQGIRHNKTHSPPPGQEIDGPHAPGRWLIYRCCLPLRSTALSQGQQHESIYMHHCAYVENRWEAFCRGRSVHHCISQGGSGDTGDSGDSSDEPASWNQPPPPAVFRVGEGGVGRAPAALAASILQLSQDPNLLPPPCSPKKAQRPDTFLEPS